MKARKITRQQSRLAIVDYKRQPAVIKHASVSNQHGLSSFTDASDLHPLYPYCCTILKDGESLHNVVTPNELRVAFPHIFLELSEAKEFIRTKLTGTETSVEAFVKVQQWHDKIKADTEVWFNSSDDLW